MFLKEIQFNAQVSSDNFGLSFGSGFSGFFFPVFFSGKKDNPESTFIGVTTKGEEEATAVHTNNSFFQATRKKPHLEKQIKNNCLLYLLGI